MNRKYFPTILLTLLLSAGPSSFASQKTASSVDLERYMGQWYEVARLPNRHQKGCYQAQAYYQFTTDNKIQIDSSCYRKSKNSPKDITATGYAVPNTGNSKLKIQYLWPIYSDYWILDVAPDYAYALVGHPTKRYLWILSREPTLDDKIYKKLISKAENEGYAVDKIQRTQA